jgi:hypothetical protein
MKAIKLIGLFTLLILGGCKSDLTINSDAPEINENSEVAEKYFNGPNYYAYDLFLKFQDESGNSLLKGIECKDWVFIPEYDEGVGSVNFDFYALEIAVPEPCQDTYFLANKERPGVILEEKATPKLFLRLWNGNYYFEINYRSFENPWGEYENCPPAEMITYKLSCPFVFGDDAVHEIVTWWRPYSEKTLNGHPKNLCYRIELDGEEFTQITTELYDGNSKKSVATIILKKENDD